MSLIAELKRRNVFRVGVAYAIVAWLLVEVASVVLPTFEAPEWVMKVFTFLVILGFPLALLLAWAFELTPEGVKRETAVDPDDSITPVTDSKLDFAIIGLLAIAVVYIAVDKLVLQSEPEPVGIDTKQDSARESGSREESIAVLPFLNMSSDPEQVYFSEGISEEILNELAQLPGLRVASRTSAFTFKGDNRNMGAIASVLMVEHVLEGSVRKSGDRVRISAQLIDARNEKQLWSEIYDRDLVDIFAVQREIARAVARKIEIELGPKEDALLTRTVSVNPEAHEAYLRGQFELAKYTAGGSAKAIEHFRKAIVADPAYALAYAGLADAYFSLGQPLGGMPRREAMPEAKAAALKAIELDASLSDAYTHLALVTWVYDWEWKKADQLFRRAIELNPNSAVAYGGYSIYLTNMGRHEEAIERGTRALELDPLSLPMRAHRAEVFYTARDYERSIAECQSIVEINPGFQRAYSILRWNYLVLENYDKAIEAELLEGSITTEEAKSLRAAHVNLDKEGYWRWRLTRYEAERSKGNFDPIGFAWVHANLGDLDAAFASLDEAFEMRDGSLMTLKEDTWWDPLRGDPRFGELLRRMNFPDS
jgi:serine/threonine-protein kinase